jgi:hypothetical protein
MRSRRESRPGKARVSDSLDRLARHDEEDQSDRERREQIAQDQHRSCTDGEYGEQQYRCDGSDLKMHCSSFLPLKLSLLGGSLQGPRPTQFPHCDCTEQATS